MSEWQDISTAPHGKRVRIFAYTELSPGHVRFHTAQGIWPNDGGGWISKDLPRGSVITKWKPLTGEGQ